MSNIEELQALKRDVFSALHCALPGLIVSYDSDSQTASIRIGVKTRSGEEFPILQGVPVFMPVTFTVSEGDHCLVIFADLNVDQWIAEAEIAPAGSDRMHSLSDGFAFVGFDSDGGQGGGGGGGMDPDDYYDKTAVDSLLQNKKSTQTAVSDPSADGNGLSFIDSISQDTAGVITPHKKNVSGMSGASSSANGAAGLVPAPVSGDQEKFLKGNGAWSNIPGMTGATSSANGIAGLVPAPASGDRDKFLKGNGVWSDIPGMTGATSSANGAAGLVPAPASGNQRKFLRADGTWEKPTVILSYGHSTWQDFIDAYKNNAVIYCRASSNSNPASGEQLRLALMGYLTGTAETPTSVEFNYYRSVSSKSDSNQGDQVIIYKLTDAGVWTVTTRNAYTKMMAGDGLSSTYSSGVKTFSLAPTTVVEYASTDDFSTLFTPNENYTVRKIKVAYSGKMVMLYLNVLANVAIASGLNKVGQIIDDNFKPAIDAYGYANSSAASRNASMTWAGWISLPVPVNQYELISIGFTYLRA